jgi:hypothetical protein
VQVIGIPVKVILFYYLPSFFLGGGEYFLHPCWRLELKLRIHRVFFLTLDFDEER